MTEKRTCVSFPGGYVIRPEFLQKEGENPDAAERMNRFFDTLCEAAETQGRKLLSEKENGIRRLTADYKSTWESPEILRIEYTVRLCRHGKTEQMRKAVFTWQDGFLCRPAKRKVRKEKSTSDGRKRNPLDFLLRKEV